MIMDFNRDDRLQKYVVIDFETCSTNLASLENKVWQLGVLIFQGDKILDEQERFVKWEPLNISKQAALITKFNKAEYQKKWEDQEIVFDYLTELLYDPNNKILFHNGLAFEVYLYNNWRKIMGKDSDWSYLNRCIDTNAIAKGIKKEIKYNPKSDFLCYQYSMLSIVEKGLKSSLSSLGKEFSIKGIDFDNLHRALEDCRLTRLIWNKLKYQIDLAI